MNLDKWPEKYLFNKKSSLRKTLKPYNYHKKIEINFLIMGKAKLYFSKKNGKNSTTSILNNIKQ